uniref:Coiled-coil domain-containing protein 43 n=1 Tax=Panstrongylus megistus TaxID=65343 RepID=A0A069DQQ7_9HEMI
MAASLEVDFDSWLSLKLKSLNTDEGVFGSYITGILTGDETLEEKTEALEGILAEITENDISDHCSEILDRWKSCHKSPESETLIKTNPFEDVEEKLVRLLETNTLSTTVHREYTEEERRIREAILAQYSQTSDQESGGEEDSCSGEGKENGLVRNTNASAVAQAEKVKREKAKIDSQKKKEKDREDRERQKQQQQEKKEKRKTQKGERRR